MGVIPLAHLADEDDSGLSAPGRNARVDETRPDRVGIFLVLAVLALALAVRMVHFVAIADSAFPRFPVLFTESDMSAFWEWANRIAHGDWLGRNTYHPYFRWMRAIADEATFERWGGGKAAFHQAPLYPYWLAVLRAAGGTLTSVLWVQLLVGALQPLVVFGLARRLFDRTVALTAAALAAVYGPLIFFQGSLLRDWLPPLLDPLALLALLGASERGRPRPWLVAGIAVGFAVLAKETALVLLPISLGWCLASRRSQWKQRVPSALLLLAGFLLCLAPVAARNVAVGAPWYRLSASGPGSLVLGFAADSDPIGFQLPPSLPQIFARSDGRLAAVVRETLATYHGHYGKLAWMQWLKFRAIVDPFEAADNLSYYYGLDISPVLRFCPGYGAILPLAVAGFALGFRRRRDHMLVTLYTVAAVGGLMLANVHARYRLILVPVLFIYAGAFVVSTVRALREKRIGSVMIAVILAVALAILQHAMSVVPPSRYMRPQEYLLAAELYEQQGAWDRAAGEMERLIRRADQAPAFAADMPRYQVLRRLFTAMGLLQRGRSSEAQRELEAVTALDPGLALPHYLLGLLYTQGGDPAAGRAQLQRFLELQPAGGQADQIRRLLGAGAVAR